MEILEWERDCDLRTWTLIMRKNADWQGFAVREDKDYVALEITDILIRELCKKHCHPYKSWQDWMIKNQKRKWRDLRWKWGMWWWGTIRQGEIKRRCEAYRKEHQL